MAKKPTVEVAAPPEPKKRDRPGELRARAEILRNLPKWAAKSEHQERSSLESALFYVAAEILSAIATALEKDG